MEHQNQQIHTTTPSLQDSNYGKQDHLSVQSIEQDVQQDNLEQLVIEAEPKISLGIISQISNPVPISDNKDLPLKINSIDPDVNDQYPSTIQPFQMCAKREELDRKYSDMFKMDLDFEKEKLSQKKKPPRKPLSPYIFFSQEQRKEIKIQQVDVTAKQIMKLVSKKWQEIKDDKEQIEKYEYLSLKDREAYSVLRTYYNKIKLTQNQVQQDSNVPDSSQSKLATQTRSARIEENGSTKKESQRQLQLFKNTCITDSQKENLVGNESNFEQSKGEQQALLKSQESLLDKDSSAQNVKIQQSIQPSQNNGSKIKENSIGNSQKDLQIQQNDQIQEVLVDSRVVLNDGLTTKKRGRKCLSKEEKENNKRQKLLQADQKTQNKKQRQHSSSFNVNTQKKNAVQEHKVQSNLSHDSSYKFMNTPQIQKMNFEQFQQQNDKQVSKLLSQTSIVFRKSIEDIPSINDKVQMIIPEDINCNNKDLTCLNNNQQLIGGSSHPMQVGAIQNISIDQKLFTGFDYTRQLPNNQQNLIKLAQDTQADLQFEIQPDSGPLQPIMNPQEEIITSSNTQINSENQIKFQNINCQNSIPPEEINGYQEFLTQQNNELSNGGFGQEAVIGMRSLSNSRASKKEVQQILAPIFANQQQTSQQIQEQIQGRNSNNSGNNSNQNVNLMTQVPHRHHSQQSNVYSQIESGQMFQPNQQIIDPCLPIPNGDRSQEYFDAAAEQKVEVANIDQQLISALNQANYQKQVLRQQQQMIDCLAMHKQMQDRYIKNLQINFSNQQFDQQQQATEMINSENVNPTSSVYDTQDQYGQQLPNSNVNKQVPIVDLYQIQNLLLLQQLQQNLVQMGKTSEQTVNNSLGQPSNEHNPLTPCIQQSIQSSIQTPAQQIPMPSFIYQQDQIQMNSEHRLDEINNSGADPLPSDNRNVGRPPGSKKKGQRKSQKQKESKEQ